MYNDAIKFIRPDTTCVTSPFPQTFLSMYHHIYVSCNCLYFFAVLWRFGVVVWQQMKIEGIIIVLSLLLLYLLYITIIIIIIIITVLDSCISRNIWLDTECDKLVQELYIVININWFF